MKFLNRKPQSFWASLPLLFAVLVVSGCGESGPEIVPVSGVVTLDGQPLPDARVMFDPQGESGLSSVATTDSEGKFTLKTSSGDSGTVPGKHTIRISTKKIEETDAGMKTVVEEKVPAKFNTESTLTFEVPAEGTDKANFDLTSK